jgi:hypothetical protein
MLRRLQAKTPPTDKSREPSEMAKESCDGVIQLMKTALKNLHSKVCFEAV